MSIAFDVCGILLAAMVEQLVASCHKAEAAHLWEIIVVEDRQWVVVAGIW